MLAKYDVLKFYNINTKLAAFVKRIIILCSIQRKLYKRN